jgi:dTDP-glucose 4,6-dehydratase
MSLLVTGGAGFIGSHFVRIILEKQIQQKFGNRILIVDNLSYASDLNRLKSSILHPSVEFIEGDIADRKLMADILESGDAIVNFAAESHVDNSISSSSEFIHSNIVGVDNLLNVAREKNVAKFVQISTDEVYGSILRGSFSEEDLLVPSSPYSASKASADLLCIASYKTFGLNVSITRAANNYGQYQYPEKIIPLFIKKLTAGETVTLYGDGLNEREWLHVDDHCDGVLKVLMGGQAGRIYNIGSGISLTNLELTKLILAAAQKGANSVEYVTDRLGHDQRYSLNFERIRTELGYQPKRDIRLDINDLVKAYQSTLVNSE